MINGSSEIAPNRNSVAPSAARFQHASHQPLLQQQQMFHGSSGGVPLVVRTPPTSTAMSPAHSPAGAPFSGATGFDLPTTPSSSPPNSSTASPALPPGVSSAGNSMSSSLTGSMLTPIQNLTPFPRSGPMVTVGGGACVPALGNNMSAGSIRNAKLNLSHIMSSDSLAPPLHGKGTRREKRSTVALPGEKRNRYDANAVTARKPQASNGVSKLVGSSLLTLPRATSGRLQQQQSSPPPFHNLAHMSPPVAPDIHASPLLGTDEIAALGQTAAVVGNDEVKPRPARRSSLRNRPASWGASASAGKMPAPAQPTSRRQSSGVPAPMAVSARVESDAGSESASAAAGSGIVTRGVGKRRNGTDNHSLAALAMAASAVPPTPLITEAKLSRMTRSSSATPPSKSGASRAEQVSYGANGLQPLKRAKRD